MIIVGIYEKIPQPTKGRVEGKISRVLIYEAFFLLLRK